MIHAWYQGFKPGCYHDTKWYHIHHIIYLHDTCMTPRLQSMIPYTPYNTCMIPWHAREHSGAGRRYQVAAPFNWAWNNSQNGESPLNDHYWWLQKKLTCHEAPGASKNAPVACFMWKCIPEPGLPVSTQALEKAKKDIKWVGEPDSPANSFTKKTHHSNKMTA